MSATSKTFILRTQADTEALAKLREKLHRAEGCYSASVNRGDAKFQTDEWHELVCDARSRYERARSVKAAE